ncbi:hypothetical protein CspHIS471_0203390 [Cutaneotrichosporon sp. HIS471]|nr:hypothetical protein CspHIS471_0203390 [Cutaneotrichosporon sp. HIS471]
MATPFKPRDNPAFILHGKLNTSYEQLPVPEVGPDDVLVQVKETGICGSDVHFYNSGRLGLVSCCGAMALGHESAGEIVQLGANLAAAAESNKPIFRVGDRVTLEPGTTCRMCSDCRTGQYQICEHMEFAAYPPINGTLQRYYKLPHDLVYPLPDNVETIYGAMMEPLSVAVHSVSNVGGLRTNQNVLIFGAGPVGLLAMAVAKGIGAARVIGRGHGSIDLVVDATGAESCIAMGLNAVRPGGTFVQTGFGPPDVAIPMFRVVTNEIKIKGSWRYGSGDYPLAIDLVARGLVDLKPLLTHQFPFENALEAFELTRAGKDKDGKPVIKCVIHGPK